MPEPGPKLKRAVASWALYDFANSSFTTVIVTFVYSVFFSKAMTGDEITGPTPIQAGRGPARMLDACVTSYLNRLKVMG